MLLVLLGSSDLNGEVRFSDLGCSMCVLMGVPMGVVMLLLGLGYGYG